MVDMNVYKKFAEQHDSDHVNLEHLCKKLGGKNLPIVNTLEDLVRELRSEFDNDHVNIELVDYLMKSYKSNPSDWKKFAKFDRYRYTRNLVDNGNGKYNLIALCWGEGHGSAIHDHANSHCFMKILQGTLQEVRFAWPHHIINDHGEAEWNENDLPAGMVETKRTPIKVNDVAYMSDHLGLHRVENLSSVDKAVSLHLYCPPYQSCKVFNQNNGKSSIAKVTFWSIYGNKLDKKALEQPEDN